MSQEAELSHMFKASTILTILSMSFIKSKLDISSASATKKKP